ncbi:hypothetical protein K1719_042526 [Acacia pycnantha]|nr:hypothetical protein K1719_042526 [Acacia pycnantha]
MRTLIDVTTTALPVIQCDHNCNISYMNSPLSVGIDLDACFPYKFHALHIWLKSDKIQASIPNKSIFKHYEKDPMEGRCYFIANLKVIPNGKDYKVAKHNFKLPFNYATYVKEEEALRYEFPSEIDSLIGKKMILKMKLNNYNKGHPNSSVLVATAKCADLIDDFNEVGQLSILHHDEEEDIVFMRNATTEDKDSENAEVSVTLFEMLPTIELDEVSISNDITILPSKGKRKVSSKKASAPSSKAVAYVSSKVIHQAT